ncbi:ABC transporter permease [Thiomicrorhabdus sp. Milos-T2]|uniref:ABC transporter permease n=1 Tax=Thiomicrorhabdus sp. Milos-T2 TaxID=90814 RepID=UPI0004947DBD|nr:FtsX-like permease family protein [Thiomicrorhabdus sp. Milos-T2]
MLKSIKNEAITASKWFFRSLKKGDWLWLIIAVIIASSTVTVVKQLGETVQQSMLRKASESIGADLVIKSSRPIEQHWQQQAIQLGLKTFKSTALVTMAATQKDNEEPTFQLIQLKGISANQPLRGKFTANNILPYKKLNKHSVWVEPKLVSLMQLDKNSKIILGSQEFSIAGSIESPQVINPMASFAPQIWLDLSVLKQTKLIGPGSRVNYSLAVSGPDKAIKQFAKLVKQKPTPHWQVVSAKAPSEDLGNTLETAWLFLDLSALSAILVAGMSILIASRFYLNRWKNSMALMRAFGANNGKMTRLFGFQLTWIAVFSSLIGVLLGYIISLIIHPFLANFFTPLVTANPITAMTIGFFSGILVLWTFAWQAFQSALKTAPIQILKSVPSQAGYVNWLISFLLLLTLVSLMLNIKSIIWIVIGILIFSLLLFLASMLLLKFLNFLQSQSRGWFKIALSNLNKEPGLVQIQLISVGMVLFVLMLMTFVRHDLLGNWQASLPKNTPNTFVMNIQPEQKLAVDKLFTTIPNKSEAPMVRGRLVKINNQTVLASQQANERGKRLLQRESNIAILDTIPSHNQIVAKLNHSPSQPFVSVEQSIAELFGIKLGDTLTFNISGQNLNYQVTSIRKVDWQSFKLNFFFIIEPVETRSLPFTYISNFYLPVDDNEIAPHLTQQLAIKTPGVLLIDVRKIMTQIQDVMNQASWAVSALYLFTLLASVGVLFTATLASQQTRIQSWLLLRTLGAQNKEIIKIGLTEFVFLGGLAGILAASFAQIASLLISVYLLKTEPTVDLTVWLLSLISGSSLLLIIGLITQWNYLKQSPQKLKKYLTNN